MFLENVAALLSLSQQSGCRDLMSFVAKAHSVLFCFALSLCQFCVAGGQKEGTESFLGVTAVGACWTFSLGLGVI